MAKVLTGISGNLISAASAGFAPTNKADVSAIASAYQVVSATATQLYAGTAYVTSVNGAPLSASRAGNAANASLASSAWYDGTGRLISALPDTAAVSAIASAYAESAVSGKQDELTFSYDDDKISAINGSALAGQGGGGGGGSVVSPSGTITVTDGTSIEATNSAVGITGGYDSSIASYAPLTRYTYTTSTLLSGVSITGADKLTVQWEPPYEQMGDYIGMQWSAFSGDTDDTLISSFEQYIYDDTNESDLPLDTSWTISRIDAYKFDGWVDRLIQTGKALAFSRSLPTGSAVLELAWKPVYGYDTAGQISSVDGSALGGVVSGVSTYSGYVTSVNGSSIMGVPSAHKYYQYSGFNYKGNSATASTTIAPYVLSSFVYTLPAGCNSVYFAGFPNANVSASSKLNNGTVVVNSQTYNNCVTASSEISAVRFIWSGTGNQTYYRTASASAGVYHPSGDVVIPLASVADVLESAVLKADDRLALAGAYAESSCIAVGTGAKAYEASIAVGKNYNTANAESIAVGSNNSATFYGYAVGVANTASGSAMAHGYANGASGQSLSLGGYNSSQSASVAVGALNTAGTTSVAMGLSNTASQASFVQGIQNSGYWNSLAVGSANKAGSLSVAIGASNSANQSSFTQGRACYASANSFAQGSYNNASNHSFAQGKGLLAKNTAAAFGTFNNIWDGDTSTGSSAAFVIGDGTASDALHDLMVVTKDGEITMYSGTADTTGTGIMSSIRALSANGDGVDSATVSAIASAYQVVSSLSADGSYVTRINDKYISASNAFNAEYAKRVLTGNEATATAYISSLGGVDSATVSAIASSYAESAVSSKMDSSAIQFVSNSSMATANGVLYIVTGNT